MNRMNEVKLYDDTGNLTNDGVWVAAMEIMNEDYMLPDYWVKGQLPEDWPEKAKTAYRELFNIDNWKKSAPIVRYCVDLMMVREIEDGDCPITTHPRWKVYIEAEAEHQRINAFFKVERGDDFPDPEA